MTTSKSCEMDSWVKMGGHEHIFSLFQCQHQPVLFSFWEEKWCVCYFIPSYCKRICAPALQVGAERNQPRPVGCCRGRSSHRYKSNYEIKTAVWVCACTCAGGCAPSSCRRMAITRATAVMSYSWNKQICFMVTALYLWSLAAFYLKEKVFVYWLSKIACLPALSEQQ